jgi:hypothetical protein
MARRQIVHWPRQSAESQDVWSSSSDRALHVMLHSSLDLGGRLRPSSVLDRLMPFLAIGIPALSGLAIGWVLLAP